MRALSVTRPSSLTGAILLTCLALSACASSPGTSETPQSTAETTAPSGGGPFLSVVGTPFLIAFKIPLCAASVVVAAPLAGLSALTPNDQGGQATRQALGAGLAHNCGPPYAIAP
jgi:hypothetical protein